MKKVSFVCDCCGRTIDGSTLHALVRLKQCYPLCVHPTWHKVDICHRCLVEIGEKVRKMNTQKGESA